jgi:hypothetical protein
VCVDVEHCAWLLGLDIQRYASPGQLRPLQMRDTLEQVRGGNRAGHRLRRVGKLPVTLDEMEQPAAALMDCVDAASHVFVGVRLGAHLRVFERFAHQPAQGDDGCEGVHHLVGEHAGERLPGFDVP